MLNARTHEAQPAALAARDQDRLLAHLRRQLRSAEAAATHAPLLQRTGHRARADRLTRTIFAVRAKLAEA